MDGCAPDDPNRLDTPEQLVALLRTVEKVSNIHAEDVYVPLYPKNAGIYHMPVHDMLNNVFNKRAIGGLVFNRYLGDQSIIVRKSVLERIMPGEKPLPPNFKDAPE